MSKIEKIEALAKTLTGDLLADCETQQEIYRLKKELLEEREDFATIDEVDEYFGYECENCSG